MEAPRSRFRDAGRRPGTHAKARKSGTRSRALSRAISGRRRGAVAYRGPVHQRIEHYEALTSVFGSWPSFHDAEVMTARLGQADRTNAPYLEVDVHLWATGSEVDVEGHFVRSSHTLARLRFEGIDGLTLLGFEAQNVLWDFEFEPVEDPALEPLRWVVTMDASVGMETRFRCAGISVVSATPFEGERGD
jgi:Immunity protein 50